MPTIREARPADLLQPSQPVDPTDVDAPIPPQSADSSLAVGSEVAVVLAGVVAGIESPGSGAAFSTGAGVLVLMLGTIGTVKPGLAFGAGRLTLGLE